MRQVVIFISAVLLSLLAVPAINLFHAASRHDIKWKEKSFFYNMDFLSSRAARLLYPLGISTNPKQVLIGHGAWLFLGDSYEQTRTVGMRPPTSEDVALGQKIGAASSAWDAWLATQGVKLFRIMMGPNKGSIYPETLPTWAKTVSPNATDALFAGTGGVIYLDLRKPLLLAKAQQPIPLYYKTDTHWNAWGAALAFRAFAEQAGLAAPELLWPAADSYEVLRVDPRGGGDLANFLRMQAYLSDVEPVLRGPSPALTTTQFDFETKKVIFQGGNPVVGSPQKPLLVSSPGALNKRRVLWLRDSFGSVMSPLMAATFSDVLQLHWSEGFSSPERFIKLVNEFKPEYVFFTVVERSARSAAFAVFPPAQK